jgi:hypothetical protein
MPELDELRRKARKVARFLGHDLKPFVHDEPETSTTYTATCKACGAKAFINTAPAVNDIAIKGVAIVHRCKSGMN